MTTIFFRFQRKLVKIKLCLEIAKLVLFACAIRKSYFCYCSCFVLALATQHVGPLFPDQGLNLCPLHWKCEVLTTGPPVRSQTKLAFDILFQNSDAESTKICLGKKLEVNSYMSLRYKHSPLCLRFQPLVVW